MDRILIISGGRNYRQYVNKYVDNIHVQIQCSKNVLLWADRQFVITAHHQLSAEIERLKKKQQLKSNSFQFGLRFSARNLLINQIDTEQQCSQRCINQLNDRSSEEYGNNAKEHEQDQCDEENAIAHGEIVLGLHCKQCQCQAYGGRGTNGQHYRFGWHL